MIRRVFFRIWRFFEVILFPGWKKDLDDLMKEHYTLFKFEFNYNNNMSLKRNILLINEKIKAISPKIDLDDLLNLSLYNFSDKPKYIPPTYKSSGNSDAAQS